MTVFSLSLNFIQLYLYVKFLSCLTSKNKYKLLPLRGQVHPDHEAGDTGVAGEVLPTVEIEEMNMIQER